MITIKELDFSSNITTLKKALDKLRPVIIKERNGHTITHKGVSAFIPFTTTLTRTQR
jgi:hypothetical protein